MSEQTAMEMEQPRIRPIDILEQMNSDAPVFLGFSPRGPVREPFEIKRWGQFIVKFGSMKKAGYLATAAKGFFENGGSHFIVLNMGERPEGTDDVVAAYKESLQLLDEIPDIPFVIAPGEHDPLVQDAILDYCQERGIYAVLDGPEELVERVEEPLDEEGAESEIPSEIHEAGTEAVLDEVLPKERYENMPRVEGDKGILVFPWLYLRDRVMGNFYIPPSGHVAGILCRLHQDDQRPEFETIKGTILLKYKFSREEIDEYSSRGINFLRYPTKHPGFMLYE